MKLVLFPNPILREYCETVDKSELDHIKSLVPEMERIMNEEEGIGLAANQIGIAKRFFILKISDNAVKLFLNPEILEMSNEETINEGCLSLPGVSAEVSRAKKLKLKFLDENFSECTEEYVDMLAVAIQHEVDHVDGLLYTDHLLPLRKTRTLEKYRKFMKGLT